MNYVVGFLFDELKENVVLIRKNKPNWQNGLLNGVGGKVEPGESFEQAMTREFKEEAGLYIDIWHYFFRITGGDYTIRFYYHIDKRNLYEQVESKTEELLEKIKIIDLNQIKVIDNLKWLIPMCLDQDHTFGSSETK